MMLRTKNYRSVGLAVIFSLAGSISYGAEETFDLTKLDCGPWMPSQKIYDAWMGEPRLTIAKARKPKVEKTLLAACTSGGGDVAECRAATFYHEYSFEQIDFMRNDLALTSRSQFEVGKKHLGGDPPQWSGILLKADHEYVIVISGRGFLGDNYALVAACEITR